MGIKKAAFAGGGMIGAGLAVSAATHGFMVTVQTHRQVDLCRDRVGDILSFLERKAVVTPTEAAEALERIAFTTEIREAVEGAGLIQESVPDHLELKQKIVDQIEQFASPEAVIATSTSSLSITEIFRHARRPQRCMGGHPYHPAYLLPLIEITKGERTEGRYVDRARAFYAAMGKETVVLQRDSTGFIANRFQSAIHRELIDLVMSGICSAEDADKALVWSVGARWAVIGQAMTLHLGAAPDGLSGFSKKYGIKAGVPDPRFAALADWSVYPEGWDKVLGGGVEEELAHRAPETGTDLESVARWRDDMLVEILKLHKKL